MYVLWICFDLRQVKKLVICIFCSFLKQFMTERCLSNVCFADLFHFCSFLKQFMIVKTCQMYVLLFSFILKQLSNVCFVDLFNFEAK